MSAPAPRSTAPWDLSFLRVGSLATAAATAVAAPTAGILGGWGSAVAVLVGAATVVGFFVVSGVVIAWAGGIDDALALPAALGTFLVKLLVLFALLGSLPEDGWLDRLVLAWTVIAGTLLWSGVQMRWVWTRQVFYVPPPAPAGGGSEAASPDPESPAPRG
jgi:ATP synthase protein I